ncbi:MAG: hypothetical protein CVU56_13250 [Deltaproteobacteria bacterium HGW-Deltaproteobacteria-14]|nr:MAG: hypothetical protein CVU56_13250 [Deltaproteobacteria bacterium HGW-Deltaproteobacteria-14]
MRSGALACALALFAAASPTRAAPPAPLRVTTVDLIDALDEGAIAPPLAGRPPLECVQGQPHPPFPSFYSTLPRGLLAFHQRVTVAGGGPGRVELRDALLFRAPRAFSYAILPPEAPRLEFSYHLFTCQGAGRRGLTARITVEDADGVVTLRVPLPPVAAGEGSRWQDVAIDLPLAARRPARLEVAFEAATPGVAVAWSQPVVTGLPEPDEAVGDDVNVLLIVVDALRADVVGSARRADMPSITPHLDALFARATSFTQAYSVANQTRPSTLGLLVSQAPSVGGFHSRSWTLSDQRKGTFYKSDPPLLTRLLARAGWTVAHIGQNHFLWEGQAIGFDHGFDRAVDFRAVPENTPETTAEAVRFIGANADRRWFALLNYTAPHTPYDPPEPFGSDVEALLGDKPKDGVSRKYLGEVAFVDDAVQRVFAALDAYGLTDRTLVILTADHAETMHSAHACFSPKLEMHCEYNHGVSLYAEELHVPLAFALPGRALAGQVVPTAVSHVDLAPTVLELVGLPPALRHTGFSLGPVLAGAPAPARAVYSEGRYAAAVQVGDLRLIVHSREDDIRPRARVGRFTEGAAPLYELFDLAVDPDETDNLALTADSRLDGMLTDLDAVRESLAALASADAVHQPASPEAQTEDLGPEATNVLRLEGDAATHKMVARIRVGKDALAKCDAADGVAACAADDPRTLLATFSARSGEPAEVRFTTAPWAASIELELTLDGAPLPVDHLRLGPYGVRLLTPGETLDRPEHLRLAAGERGPQTVADTVGAYLWRDLPHVTRRVAAPEAGQDGDDPDAHMSDEVRSVLRGLGYTK